MTKTITVTATINAPIDKVWKLYTEPKHITKWNNASADWHTPWAKNDLKVGGRFVSRMEAKDGSAGFDFGGTYNEVKTNKQLSYIIDGDKRKVSVTFSEAGANTKVTVTFDPENENPEEVQRDGWQSILNNFKKYIEGN